MTQPKISRPSVAETSRPSDAMAGLFHTLEASDHFHRDTRVGRIFHPGKVSFREVVATDSLHVIVDGDRLSVHIDDVSPLRRTADGSFRYSWGRVVAHNLVAGVAEVGRRFHRHQGNQRCNLECEAVLIEDADDSETAAPVRRGDPK